MNFLTYLFTSIYVFILCFYIGTSIDQQFEKIQKQFNLTPLFAGFLQIFVIISITYILYQHTALHLESYSPHLLFSSFLFGLQTNMIKNLKTLKL